MSQSSNLSEQKQQYENNQKQDTRSDLEKKVDDVNADRNQGGKKNSSSSQHTSHEQ